VAAVAVSPARARASPSRRPAAPGLLLSALLLLLLARDGAALLAELSPADVQQALDAGARGATQEEFGEEWRIQLPGGEEIVVSTPFSRLAHAARQATFKGEPLTAKQLQEQIDRGKGKIQLVVRMFGRQADFARWYQPLLRVGTTDVKPTFTQNERTGVRLEDGRFAARNVYVFPVETLLPKGAVTLVVMQSPTDKKEVLRASLDLSTLR